MKITHNKVGQNLNTSDTKSEKTSKTSGAAKTENSEKASNATQSSENSQATKVQLSSRAQDLKKIKEIATSAPDVDSNKVERFKRMIAEGKYKVDAQAVADRMVDEHLKDLGSTSND